MANNYFQDVPENNNDSGQKSIRNITVTSRQRPLKRQVISRGTEQVKRQRKSGLVIWVVAFVSIIALVGAGFFVFRGTKVSVIPREQTVVFDEQTIYTAYPKGEELSSGSIVYSTISREFEESESVEATSVESVEENANGTITVVNDHSSADLRLIKNTRFETPSGLIYRIRNSVDVPGKVGDRPGELEVVVYADEPGERYNIGPVSRFTLPGLRTTGPEMFTNVYARSDAPISGGFVGERPVVSENDQASTQSQLRTRLDEKARSAFGDAQSDDLYIFPELQTVVYEILPPEFADDGSVRVRQKATVSAPAFDGGVFAKALAEVTSADAGSGEVGIADPSKFTIGLINPEEIEIGKDVLEFTLSGNATFVWSVDTNLLARDLAGNSKESFQNILEKHPGIEEASAQIRPFWKRTFPEDANKIKIEVVSVNK
ncbi:hypothetical protein COU13_02030 [Candidatus Kaiserbacteria bacterium CG10_big_fil_rev_8_21_14_0_10_43_70]|uniref:Baseplate protein J-like domain-containing protein n=1 Tax=Candidatus Kaiserbacteria bacterium CG10_big_fil_rev_8_21_14_0_10_43_70 TaxID=1974605 RepID=A0A2H0UKQ0_9BACT|nr:MAG: hypothetical protein COU13_02030 [Candidatus Kaiserbacteria bacterium CG10_big_fil_rev_8_21_14_0_10_43_70]